MIERLLELRKALNLTQTQFGEKIGLTRAAIAAYERGIAKPTGSALKCMEVIFNVNMNWLETGEGEMFVETPQAYVESLIAEHDLGPGGQMLMRALLRFYEELGEEATLKIIAEILPDAQQTVSETVAENLLSRVQGSEGSEQESAGSA